MSLTGKAKVRMPCPFPLDSDFAGMMRPGHDQSIPFGLSAAPGVFQLFPIPVGQSCRFALVEVPASERCQR
jgi:hypothetical protein